MSQVEEKTVKNGAAEDDISTSSKPRPNGRRNRKTNNRNHKKGNRRNNSDTPKDTRVTGDVSSYSAFLKKADAKNDLAWYTKYASIIEAGARFPFINRPGDILGISRDPASSPVRDIPGIMVLEYQAAVGTSVSNDSPASICARGVWDQIRDAYSGRIGCEPPDVFFYMMHLDQFIAYLAWLKRMYGILNFWTPYNHYTPYKLFQAMFPSNVRNNISQEVFNSYLAVKPLILSWINELAAMANKYVVPEDFPIFERHRWMNENIYLDEPSMLGQWYLFTPKGFWMVEGVDIDETGTRMDFVPISNTFTNPQYVHTFGINMFNRLADWDGARTINGYLKRAYEGRYYPGATTIDPSYIVRPTYNFEVLTQIHNARVFKEYIENHWKQNPITRAIVVTQSNLNYNLEEPVIDIPAEEPDGASFIIASRLTPVIVKVVGSDIDYHYEMKCGTEIVSGIYTLYRSTSSTPISSAEWRDISDFHLLNYLNNAGQRNEYMVKNLHEMVNYTAFSMAPILKIHYQEVGNADPDEDQNATFFTYLGEIHNPTVVDGEALARLHRVCQASLFNVYKERV